MIATEETPGTSATASSVDPVDPTPKRDSISRGVVVNIAQTVGWFLLAAASIGLLWEVGVRALGLSSFGAKGPSQVFSYLVTDPAAATNRSPLEDALITTGAHAGLGFISGVGVGLILALGFVLIPALERPLMPLILLTQSLPILAVLPLFILMLGRGFGVTIVITTLAVFFPMFVMASQGLHAVPQTHLDYFHSLDSPKTTVLFRLRLPTAVPSIFAALKVCVPSAMFGAIVSEWLATGDGLGYLMVNAAASAGAYDALWSAVALTTLLTMVAYTLIETLEQVVLGHFAPEKVVGRP
jgi:sulfonate transport system permease protein